MTDFTNPYTNPVWRGWIRGAHHGGAKALQDLALHLYNSRDWKVNLGYICGLSDDHWQCALAQRCPLRFTGKPATWAVIRCDRALAKLA